MCLFAREADPTFEQEYIRPPDFSANVDRVLEEYYETVVDYCMNIGVK